MGLLDAFFNMSPEQTRLQASERMSAGGRMSGGGMFSEEQNRGLMAAATKMLDMSAPSRVPVNFMRVAAHGMNAFNEGVQSHRDDEVSQQQRAIQQQLLGWKVKDAEADYGAQQDGREREARIQKRLAALTRNGMTPGMAASITAGGMGEQQPGAQGGGSARSLADYDTSYNGTPYTQAEADATFGAAKGMVGYEPEKLNQMMALSRQGMTLGQAAAIVFGGGRQPGAQGATGSMPSQGQQGMPDVGSQEWMQGIQQQAGMAPGGMARPSPGPMGGQPAPASGQPDWFAMGMPPQMALGMQQGKKVNRTQQMVDNMMTKAQIQFEEGDQAGLDKTLDQIQKFRPDATWKEVMENGRAVNKAFFNDGTEGDASSAEVAKGLEFRDAGDSIVGLNHFNGREESRLRKGQSPDSAAADTRFARRSSRGGGGGGTGAGAEPSLDDDTLDFLADRALRGDRTALQNLGRGGQGAANLVAVNQRVAQKAKAQGLTGGDLASINADYQGQVAGLRTSGTISARIENAAAEAAELAPLALSASEKVARSGLLPFGRAEMMFNKNTNSPAMNEFATANIGLATAYAGAMARGGKSTVADMEHAREILSTAKNHEAYKAIVGQINLEIQAAQRAPQRVRTHLRTEISGRGGDHGGGEPSGSPAVKPVITLNDIAATARSSGRSTREVTAAFRAKGFKVQGDK